MIKVNKKKLIGFVKDGVKYIKCDECGIDSEKFCSEIKIPSPKSGELMKHCFYKISWALKHGYTPIYKK